MAEKFQKKIPFCFCMASLIALTGMRLCACAGNPVNNQPAAAHARITGPAHAERIVGSIQQEKDISKNVLMAIAKRLDPSIGPDTFFMVEKLIWEKADAHLEAKAEISQLTSTDPAVSALRQKAIQCLDTGDFENAINALRQSKGQNRNAMKDPALASVKRMAAAQDCAAMAAVERLSPNSVSYRRALAAFAEAEKLAEPADKGLARRYRLKQAEVFYDLARQWNDNDALQEAIYLTGDLLKQTRKEEDPVFWAMIQNLQGNAFLVVSEQDPDPAWLSRAAASHKAALSVISREHAPRDWAKTQHDLGDALRIAGSLSAPDTELLEEALSAYNAALAETSPEHMPIEWGTIQHRLGSTLEAVGERENNAARLEQAVAAHHAALTKITRERMPLYWAMNQNNLARTLFSLAYYTPGTEGFKRSAAAYEAALTEITREQMPFYWAMTHDNLGSVFFEWGKKEAGTARLEQAAASHEAALTSISRKDMPYEWGSIQNSLGCALWKWGQRETGTERLKAAVAAFEAALTVADPEHSPHQWATTQGNLGSALFLWGQRESGTTRLEQAERAYRATIKAYTKINVSYPRDALLADIKAIQDLILSRKTNANPAKKP